MNFLQTVRWGGGGNQNGDGRAGDIRSDETFFTDDILAYITRGGGSMSRFPLYGNGLSTHMKTLVCFKALLTQYNCIASGHGHP